MSADLFLSRTIIIPGLLCHSLGTRESRIVSETPPRAAYFDLPGYAPALIVIAGGFVASVLPRISAAGAA